MPFMHDERALHTLAIERLKKGELPGQQPESIWAGNGTDALCALCGERIGGNQVEYEIRDATDRVFVFHLRCHAIWQLALPPLA